jgi:hypothetical protein
MQITKNGVLIRTLDDWKRHAPPKGLERQWEPDRSALECAKAWCGGDAGPCAPNEITVLLNSHRHTQGAELQTAIPEHRVPFDKLRGEPRNADLVIKASTKERVLAISIEAKADEPFDRTVQEIVADTVDKVAHGVRSRLNIRVEKLAASLLPAYRGGLPRLGDLRYQLLTATAGALAYAAIEEADCAVLIIHEFITNRTTDENHKVNSHDLNVFVRRLTNGDEREVTEGKLIGPLKVPGIPLFTTPIPLYIGKTSRRLRTSPA